MLADLSVLLVVVFVFCLLHACLLIWALIIIKSKWLRVEYKLSCYFHRRHYHQHYYHHCKHHYVGGDNNGHYENVKDVNNFLSFINAFFCFFCLHAIGNTEFQVFFFYGFSSFLAFNFYRCLLQRDARTYQYLQ